MKPYLIGNQWVNLDDIQAVSESVYVDTTQSPVVVGTVTLAFHSQPVQIVVGLMRHVGRKWVGFEETKSIWDAFIAAWKNRDSQSDKKDSIDPLTGRPQLFYQQHLLK